MKKPLFWILIISMLIPGAAGFALETGDRAPLFEAVSTKGIIRLDEYLGKKNVVLAFYIADFTPV